MANEEESLIKRKSCDAVEFSVYARNPTWNRTFNVYSGAIVILVHFMLHTSLHFVARLTVGICVVAEVIVLITYLNRCLRFKVTFNSLHLIGYLKNVLCFLAAVCVSLLLCYCTMQIYSKASSLSTEERLLICMPTVYGFSLFLEKSFKDYSVVTSYFVYSVLTILFAVYW